MQLNAVQVWTKSLKNYAARALSGNFMKFQSCYEIANIRREHFVPTPHTHKHTLTIGAPLKIRGN